MKILDCMDGSKIRRVSRWIKIRETWNPRKNNSLYDYADDIDFEGRKLSWFTHKGRKYAMNQFICTNSEWSGLYNLTYQPESYEDTGCICGYDAADYYSPLLLELSNDGDYVRLYESVN